MEQKKFEKNYKIFSDYDDKIISEQKLNIKIKIERRENKPKSVNEQNIDKIINNIIKQSFGKAKMEKLELKEINNLKKVSEKIINKNNIFESKNKYSSHSSKKLIKIDVKNSIEDETMNKSDDECVKMDKKFNRNKNFKGLQDEINKNDSINFNKNIKEIFNNIGNINNHKNDKEKEKDNNDDKDKEKDDLVLNIYKKDEQYIRKIYYSQLLLKKVWKPINDSKRHNSLIIFDWDDTLLPTSFLAPRGIFEENSVLNEKDQNKINKLEDSVQKLLLLAVSKSDVYIITNAGDGWVEFSAKKYYPKIMDILGKIEVISAREVYEKKFPEDSRRWKVESFLNLKKRLNDELITNIICLGDSIFEMEAGRILASKFIHAVIKTIKFREKPKPEELNKQLNLVLNQFDSIFTSSKNLTVRVEKKRKKDDY
jgi:hypothetical protein